jgi:hypothetical protein
LVQLGSVQVGHVLVHLAVGIEEVVVIHMVHIEIMVVVIDQGKFDVYFEMFVYPVMIYRCPINFDSSSSAGFRMVFDDDDDLLVV